jgi:acetyltransferase-like isoleucine patch superfamily enzyme
MTGEANSAAGVKVSGLAGAPGEAGFRKYRDLCYGDLPLGRVLWAELVQTLFSGLGGAAGLAARKLLYPSLLGQCGRGVIFGRNVTLRHPHKIRIGDGTILDDLSVIDAKGTTNSGIRLGDGVYVGRHTIVYCKNGDIELGDHVNLSANCVVFSSNRLTIGRGTVVGAFTYVLSGGEYDYRDTVHPFHEQSGMGSAGPLSIGANCWLGARVTVLDAASIADHCVIGAGAVVTRPVAADSLALGIPARVVRSIGTPPA